MVRAAQIDALFQIDGTPERLVEGGIARGDALHADARVAMAVGAGFCGRAGPVLPQGFAVQHGQHAGIGGVVVLHGFGFRRHETESRAALACRDFVGADERGRDQQRRQDDGAGCSHSTPMAAEAVSLKPLSPIHSKSNLPLSVATVKNVMKGFAAIAGNRSARKISVPL